jgi:hypothetical protein
MHRNILLSKSPPKRDGGFCTQESYAQNTPTEKTTEKMEAEKALMALFMA